MTMSRLSLFPALLVSLLLTGALAFQVHPAVTPPTRTKTPTGTTRTRKLFSVQTSQVDVSEQASRNPDGFLEWATYYGISPENFQVNTQSNNWGAVATQDAPAGSRVLFVPAMLRMTSQNVREQEFADLEPTISQYIDATYNDGDTDINLACHFYLFLKILQEYDQGDQSPYFYWLDALPRKFSTALTFSDFEMESLPPFVKFLAEKDRYNYDLFLQVLQQLNTPSISDATKSNTEVTKWAFNVVFTRARAAFGEAEIIPMSDMLNHNANPNVDVQWDDEGNVHVMLLRDVQAGEQLYKCYGQPTNPSRFFATYGFFDASPPSTYCKLYPGLAVTEELKNMGFGYDRLVFYVENGGIAEEVWDVVLVMMLLENGDPDTQQQFYNAHMQGQGEIKAQLHQFYMPQTCARLLQHVDETLGELCKCEKTMDAGGMGLVHKNLPMIRRHNDFVRQTFTKVKKNLEEIQASV